MSEKDIKQSDKIGEYIIPVDPMDLLNCESCQ